MNKGIKEELLSLAYKYSLSARELKNLALEVAQQIEANSAAAHTSTQENSSKVEVGWYAFEGGKFSPDPIAYPNRQGVVAWLNPDLKAPIGKRGLIITPDEIQLPWADEYCKTGACDTEDGVLNTGKLMAHAKMYEVIFPAAEWCHLYSGNGVKPGEGFLPAKGQFKQVVANRDLINPAIEKIWGKILKNWCWTSSEDSECKNKFALAIDTEYGCVEQLDKYDAYCVRCFLSF